MIKEKLISCRDWLLAPVGRVTDLKRRLIFRALRSRFFLIVAAVTAIPTLFQAAGATWKATHPKPDATPVLLWTLVILTWILFVLTVLLEHWSLERRFERKQSLKSLRRAESDAIRRKTTPTDDTAE